MCQRSTLFLLGTTCLIKIISKYKYLVLMAGLGMESAYVYVTRFRSKLIVVRNAHNLIQFYDRDVITIGGNTMHFAQRILSTTVLGLLLCTLAVFGIQPVQAAASRSITTNPANATIDEGQSVDFTGAVSGKGKRSATGHLRAGFPQVPILIVRSA